MTAVFIVILNMSITASVVALAVMLARIPIRKSPKIFSYALWGVVLLRLVLPFSIESIFSLMPTNANAIPQDIVFSQAPAIQTGVQFIDLPINAAINNTLPAAVMENSVNPIHVALEIAGYIWLIGFIALLLYAVAGYMNLKRRVYFATLVRDNIFETDRIKTPFVLGFLRPKIYFPVTINPEQHDYILKHEQTHIKRRDYIIKPFAFAVLALHWFNPVIWLSYFLMSKDMEMSCDEAVLRNTSEDIRGDYGASLLSLSVERVSLLNPIAFAFGESNVKERVVNVLGFKKTAKWISVVSFIAVAVFLVGFSSNRVSLAAVNISENPAAVNVLELPLPPNMASEIRGWEEWLAWFNSLSPEQQAQVSVSPPHGNTATVSQAESASQLAAKFEVYREFGLIYDPLTSHLYFNGELVRYFEDVIPLPYVLFGEGVILVITHFTENGTVDVRAVRDFSVVVRMPNGTIDHSGVVVGVEPFSQEEFDARDIDAILSPPQNSAFASSGISGSGSNGNTAVANISGGGGIIIGSIFAGAENFGVTFSGNLLSGGTGNIYYNGQLVRTLIDSNGISLSSSDRSGNINVRTVRDSRGSIAGLEVSQVYPN